MFKFLWDVTYMWFRVFVLASLIALMIVLVLGCSVDTFLEIIDEDDSGPIPWMGGSYVGEIQNALPHGIGMWNNTDGYSYDGEWEYGLKYGYGVWSGPKGVHYEGQWKDDVKYGFGLFTGSNGEKYDGEWQDDLFHGHGVWTNANGDEYTGEFVLGIFHGHGIWNGSDGGKYEGGFAYGERHGEGELTDTNDLVARGTWVEGVKQADSATAESSQSSATTGGKKDTGELVNTNLAVTMHPGGAMRFFKSASTPAGYGNRKYATSFKVDKIEYIYFEVIVSSQTVSYDREFSINFRSSQLGLDYTENYKIPAGQNQVVITGPNRGSIHQPPVGTYVIDLRISNIKPDPGLFGSREINLRGSLFKVE